MISQAGHFAEVAGLEFAIVPRIEARFRMLLVLAPGDLVIHGESLHEDHAPHLAIHDEFEYVTITAGVDDGLLLLPGR